MTRVQIKIDIPEGYEFEKVVDQTFGFCDDELSERRILVRTLVNVKKTWQWPSWLKAAAVAMEADGKWHAFEVVPVIGASERGWSGATWNGLHLTDFTPPPCTDWRQSLRLNPNRTVVS